MLMLYRLYRRALDYYQAGEKREDRSLFRPLFRAAIQAAVVVITPLKRVSFPARATGGWWWICRWRFEFLMGWLERESVTECRKLIRPGMTVADIGAHIGYYTRLFATLVGPAGRVLAFEPNPENYRVLERNLAGARNVSLLPCAVSDREDELPLYISTGHSNHSLIAGYASTRETVQVRSVRLDDVLASRKLSCDFVKSDTEGAEPRVLEGMLDTLSRNPGISLLLEYNPAALSCAGVAPETFLARLRSLGFEIRTLDADPGNLLCCRGASFSSRGASAPPARRSSP